MVGGGPGWWQKLYHASPGSPGGFVPSPPPPPRRPQRSSEWDQAASGLQANAPLSLSLSLSGQVNNATARVMTNKKTANPYTNGKGAQDPWEAAGVPVGTGGPGHWRPASQDAKHPLMLCCGPKRVGQ